MIDLFGVAWQQLEREHVDRFLATADEESITWEGKGDGDKPLHIGSVRKAACGLSNVIGGYIIVGASKNADGAWKLPGIRTRDELKLWIGKAIRGLRPEPRHEVSEVWEIDAERRAAVVWVEPVAEPPCMTLDGAIYERVAGATEPVRDPALLARLIERGDQARARAHELADHAARTAIDIADWERPSVALAVALAPISRQTDDMGSRLFAPSLRSRHDKAVWDFFGSRKPADMDIWVQQDAITVAAHVEPNGSTWLVRASWDGAVAAAALFTPEAAGLLSGFDEVVQPGWRAILPLVTALGGYGSAHLALAAQVAQSSYELGTQRIAVPLAPVPPEGTLYRQLPAWTWIRRVVELREPTAEDVGSIQREMQRAAGILSLEAEWTAP